MLYNNTLKNLILVNQKSKQLKKITIIIISIKNCIVIHFI